MNTKQNPSTQLLVHPTVTRVIEGVLRKGGTRRNEMEDAVAEVQTRTLEALVGREHPAEIAAWTALCAEVARNYVIDERRKARTRTRLGPEPCEGLDEVAPLPAPVQDRDPIDAKRQLAVMQQMIAAGEMPEGTADIIDCLAAGMSSPEIARELGITTSAVKVRIHRMRSRFIDRLVSLGMIDPPPSRVTKSGGVTFNPYEGKKAPARRRGRAPLSLESRIGR